MYKDQGFTHGYYLYPLPGIDTSDLQTESRKQTERRLLDADAWRGAEESFATCISGKENRGVSRRPEIADLIRLVGDLVDLRILVISRSPQATVNSVLRRRFSNDPEFECKLAGDVYH